MIAALSAEDANLRAQPLETEAELIVLRSLAARCFTGMTASIV
jgi:hypothetical protein